MSQCHSEPTEANQQWNTDDAYVSLANKTTDFQTVYILLSDCWKIGSRLTFKT